ncbi:unnamed protein product, partial [Meganyctiphanes norvegica]
MATSLDSVTPKYLFTRQTIILLHWGIKEIQLPIDIKDGEPRHSQCEMYIRNYSEAALTKGSSSNLSSEWSSSSAEGGPLLQAPCTSWDYDREIFHSTLISEVRNLPWR